MLKHLLPCILRLSFTCLIPSALPQAVAPVAQTQPDQPAPAPARPKKILTPAQLAYQQAYAKWLDQYNALRHQAQAAYNTEMAREKAGDCPNADSTRAEEQCLSQQISTTQANAATVTTALGAMLALEQPKMAGEEPYSGPTGTPPTSAERVAQFDQLEADSAAYRKFATQAAYDEYKGGSIAPVASALAEQQLLRLHLQELAFIYETEFSSH